VNGWRSRRAGLTDDQRESFGDTLPGLEQFEAFDEPPILPPELLPVWSAWGPGSQVGPTTTITVSGGLAPSIVLHDHRSMLYPARVVWLTENGYADPEDRAVMLLLWQVLDLEAVRIGTEQVIEKQTELSKAK